MVTRIRAATPFFFLALKHRHSKAFTINQRSSSSIGVHIEDISKILMPTPNAFSRLHSSSATDGDQRKSGVASPEELKTFVENADSKLLVVDVRNPDASVEPGDQKSLAVSGLPLDTFRPQASNLIYDRETNSLPLPDVDKDTPIITHCGGGGRGEKAKIFLMENGYTQVLNGGGPKEEDCWKEFGNR